MLYMYQRYLAYCQGGSYLIQGTITSCLPRASICNGDFEILIPQKGVVDLVRYSKSRNGKSSVTADGSTMHNHNNYGDCKTFFLAALQQLNKYLV